VVYSVFIWRLWQTVLRLAVKRNTVSGRFVRHERVRVFEEHRLPSIGSRWDIQRVSGGVKACFLCI
jgi:hypothetical protein